jgi:phage recombination protein Bet
MSSQIYPNNPPPRPFLSEEEVELLKRTMLAKFPDDEKETFIRTCQRTKLDPFTKQIYPTKRYQNVRDANGNTTKVPTLVTVTGIMGLCGIADRTGNYDGCKIHWSAQDGIWKDEWLNPEPPEAAKCIVFHKHRSHPEVGIARWGSYVGTFWDKEERKWVVTEFWDKMPDYMLAKCAKAQALRGAFPDQLSNIYIREELDSHLTDSEADLDQQQQAVRDNIQEASDKAQAELDERRAKAKAEVVEPPPKPAAPPVTPTPPPLTPPASPTQPLSSSPPSAAGLGEAIEQKRREVVYGPSGGPEGFDMSPPKNDGIQEPAWKDHVIRGVRHAKFMGHKVGDLGIAELKILEEQWIPVVRQRWDTEASDAQKEDVAAIEAAIAFHKTQRPW